MQDGTTDPLDKGVEAGSVQLPQELRFDLRKEYVTTAKWEDTGEVSPTASRGRWVEDEKGRVGLRKPGDPRPCDASVEAFREFIASELGRWLQVRVPEVELEETAAGPTIISLAVGKSVLKWGQVMTDPTALQVKPAAMSALEEYGGIVILDALIGNQDRANAGNHLYVEERQEWFGVDFSFSFGRGDGRGCGDPSEPYAQRYYPEIINAIGAAPEALARSVDLAERMRDNDIERLFAIVPSSFANAEQRGAMLDYVKKRRSNIRNLVRGWVESVGLGDKVRL